jgi:hypothetical protein
MQPVIKGLLGIFLMGAISSWCLAAGIQQQTIQFAKGQSATKIEGKIKGDQTIDYRLRATAGQTLKVNFTSKHLSAYFNVLPPASETALFVGSTYGNFFEGTLPVDGDYTIRVYLMRSAARRQETARYSLEVAIENSVSPAAVLFDKTLTLHGISFRVHTQQDGGVQQLRITPSGLEIDNASIVNVIKGKVSDAEVADLNIDGSPEIYVYIDSAEDTSTQLLAYSANKRKSLSGIFLPAFTENPQLAKGYRGHDELRVVESVMVQRFPIYRDQDDISKATGGMRQLQYKLVPGEAGWLLKLDKVVEY